MEDEDAELPLLDDVEDEDAELFVVDAAAAMACCSSVFTALTAAVIVLARPAAFPEDKTWLNAVLRSVMACSSSYLKIRPA